jgi:TATA-binding protein-associated factor Taf7
MKRCRHGLSTPMMNVKNRRSRALTVPAISPASAIIHQKLWQKLRVEEHRGGGEREPGGLQKRSRAARRARESSASLEAGRAPT